MFWLLDESRHLLNVSAIDTHLNEADSAETDVFWDHEIQQLFHYLWSSNAINKAQL